MLGKLLKTGVLMMGKDSECKMFWIGNNFGLGSIKIQVARKWIDKIFEVKRVNDRLMVDLLIGNRTVAIISTYVPQQGLAEDVKNKFYENLTSFVSKVSENES